MHTGYCSEDLVSRRKYVVTSFTHTRPSFSMDKHIGRVALPHAYGKALQSAFCLAHHAALHYEVAGIALMADITTAVSPYTYLLHG